MSIDINAPGGLHVDGDIVGRDKITAENYYAAPPTGTQALHQLPTPPADFTGRQTELNTLLQAMQTGGATITGVQGQGGIGKTALALVVADRLKAQYPDADFFIPLRGASQSPLSVEDALAHIIRAYHPAAKLPESVAELQALYRSVLAEKRAIVLLDDASGKAQVAPFLPAPAGCLLLVTSRQHFTLPGLAEPLDLGTLPPDDARALVLRLAPRLAGEAAVADEIARLCGYLPLALTAAAASVQEQVTLTPADYVRRLQGERQRLELEGLKVEGVPLSVAASFGMSYDLLYEAARDRWRRLAVFPADFDQAAAQGVWGLESSDAAQDGLGELVRYSLLEWQAERRRFSLHDLARLYAGSLLSEAARDAVALRHARHFAAVLGAANQLLLKGGPATAQGLGLFDQEWRNIEAGQDWAARHIAKSTGLAEAVNWYALQGRILQLRLPPRTYIIWIENAGLVAARQLGNRQTEGAHLGNLGNAHFALGDARRAIEFYEQQLIIASEVGDQHGEETALGNLGRAHTALGDARRAMDYHEQALAIDREIGDRLGEGQDLGNLGRAYAALGDVHRAMELFEQYLAIAREIGDRQWEGNAFGNLGDAHYLLGDAGRAMESYEQYLAIAREIGDRQGEGAALGSLGNAYAALGDAHRAIEFYEQALVVMRDIGDKRAEGSILGNLGNAYAALGDAHRAIEFYEQQLVITREIGDRQGEGHVLGNLGRVNFRLGEMGKARQALAEARQIFNALQLPLPPEFLGALQLAEMPGGGCVSIVLRPLGYGLQATGLATRLQAWAREQSRRSQDSTEESRK